MFDSASFDTGSISPLSFEFGVITTETAGGGPKKKRYLRKEDYDYSDWFDVQREAIADAVEAARSDDQQKPRLTPRKKDKALQSLEISQAEINQIAQIQSEIDRYLAIEYHLIQVWKRRRNNALALLLLLS